MARTYKLDGEATDDPFMLQFDRGMALLSYGLLFVAPFGVGLPAMVSLGLAFAHRMDKHPVTRSHYRFQGRIFWTAAALLAIGIGLLIVGGGVEMTSVLGFIQEHLTGVKLPDWAVGAYADQGERSNGDLMLTIGVVAILTAIAWIMLAALWGALQLVLGRPMGQRR
jgi:uncharacterized membrane protein